MAIKVGDYLTVLQLADTPPPCPIESGRGSPGI